MAHEDRHSSAHYDADGGIIIDGDAEAPVEPFVSTKDEGAQSRIHRNSQMAPIWVSTDVPENLPMPEAPTERTRGAISALVSEGLRQYEETGNGIEAEIHALQAEIQSMPRKGKGMLVRAWAVAMSPCIPRFSKNKRARPRSRFTLFIFDTIRFGATFAVIFGALFVAINYQSFWNIAKAELALDANIGTMQALHDLTERDRGEAPDTSPNNSVQPLRKANSGIDIEGSLLAVLPPVGPPEDRLIIPKIGKNVPIVVPPIDSLMSEDWKQFESDIQHALRDGVVHYPGTARPGQAGNFFITGHSSYYPWDSGKYKEVFALLHELEVGDTYSVYYGGDLHTYRVTSKYEVKPSDVSVLDQPTDKREATLMTCTPIGTTLRRLIVKAEEVDSITGVALKAGEQGTQKMRQPSINVLPI